MGISRDSMHKRRATGGKKKAWGKKRKYELGRQLANTKLSSNKTVRRIRVRGGNVKWCVLRLDTGNYSWGSEAVTRKTRILDVVYNASNNEVVRTQTLVKSAIVQVDAAPFKQWYLQHYGVDIGSKKKTATAAVAAAKKEGEEGETSTEEVKKSNHVLRKLEKRQQNRKLDPRIEEQFGSGHLLACISSRPGQCGRADGILYENIIEATEDFSSNYCISLGGYGIVYKAVLPIGQAVAIKKLHQSEDNILSNNLKAFENEICALSEIRHRNIVQLNIEEAENLDWKKKLNAVKGLAHALSYMHHDHSPPIVHRDISNNNVFLDSEYEAHVSDFGTARLLKPDTSNWTSLASTYRYIAPVNEVAEEVVSTWKLAFACLNGNPQLRPTMQQVAQALNCKSLPLPNPFSIIKLEELLGHGKCGGN
ncbi:hypothetical protein DITRI_Ditri13aG0132000 [Diplodiscus trichospermus]